MPAQRPPQPPYQHAQGSSDRPTTGPVPEYFRTVLCTHFRPGGSGDCPYESRCRYAHGVSQLRTMEMNIKDGLVTEEAVRQFLWRPNLQLAMTGTVLVPPPGSPPPPAQPAPTPQKLPTIDEFPTLGALYPDQEPRRDRQRPPEGAEIASTPRAIPPAPIECEESTPTGGKANGRNVTPTPPPAPAPYRQVLLQSTPKQGTEPTDAVVAVPRPVPAATIATPPARPELDSVHVFWDLASVRPPHRDVFQSAWTDHIVPALKSKGFSGKPSSRFVHAFACGNDPAVCDQANLVTALTRLFMHLHVAPTALEAHSAMMAKVQEFLDDETDSRSSAAGNHRNRSVGLVLLTNQTVFLVEKLNRCGMLNIPTCIVHDHALAEEENQILSFWATKTLSWPSKFSRYPARPVPALDFTPARTKDDDPMQVSSPDRSGSSQSISQGETEYLPLGGSARLSRETSRCSSPAPPARDSTGPPPYGDFFDRVSPAVPLTRRGPSMARIAPEDADADSETSSFSDFGFTVLKFRSKPTPKPTVNMTQHFSVLRNPLPPPYDQTQPASGSRFVFGTEA
jgi:hypothetical protein